MLLRQAKIILATGKNNFIIIPSTGIFPFWEALSIYNHEFDSNLESSFPYNVFPSLFVSGVLE